MYVEDIKLAGKKQNMNPMWKAQTTEVDLGEPTSFLDHVYSGRTQRECQIARILWIIQRYLPIKDFCRGHGKIPDTEATEKPDAETTPSWSYDMEGHAKKCVERFCEMANKNDSTIIQSRNALHG